jgi:hypothetical protein
VPHALAFVPITRSPTGIVGGVRSTDAEANISARHVVSLYGAPTRHVFTPLPPPPTLNALAASHSNVSSAQVGSSYGRVI